VRVIIDETAAGVFDPETVDILVHAFNAAWASVVASGAPFSEKRYQARAREVIAKHIIGMARLGERDSKRLAESAIAELAHTSLKPKSSS